MATHYQTGRPGQTHPQSQETPSELRQWLNVLLREEKFLPPENDSRKLDNF